MNRTTVTLPQDLLAELMSLVQAKSKTEAVLTAIKDEIRARKIERIKALAGRLEFVADTEEFRHRDHRLG